MESKKTVDEENRCILTGGSSISTNVSVNEHTTGLISTNTFSQGLFLQYLHEAVFFLILYLHHF